MEPASIFLSLRDGMGQLINQLELTLQDVEFLLGQRVTHLEQQAQSGYRIFLSNHEPLQVDAVILAVPSPVASSLIRNFAPRVSRNLESFRYVSTAIITLAFRKADIRKPFSGFGFVVPRKEKRDISACTWTSMKFKNRAPDDVILLRGFIGGPGKEEMVSLSDEEVIKSVRCELNALMSLDAEPILTRIHRWEKANPQYDVDHLTRVREIFEQCKEFPGLYLTGGSYEGVGIPDCIRQGQQAAEKVMAFWGESILEVQH